MPSVAEIVRHVRNLKGRDRERARELANSLNEALDDGTSFVRNQSWSTIDELITSNRTIWTESDREYLESVPPAILKEFMPKETAASLRFATSSTTNCSTSNARRAVLVAPTMNYARESRDNGNTLQRQKGGGVKFSPSPRRAILPPLTINWAELAGSAT